MDLWNEDVFEVFLWTDERYPVYFEYEISPLNHELPILIPNFGGQFLGWRPWHYERDRATRKATSIIGGPKQSGAAIEGWRAEFFFPYALLRPLQNVPPKPGTHWRANFYRMVLPPQRREDGQLFGQIAPFGIDPRVAACVDARDCLRRAAAGRRARGGDAIDEMRRLADARDEVFELRFGRLPQPQPVDPEQ